MLPKTSGFSLEYVLGFNPAYEDTSDISDGDRGPSIWIQWLYIRNMLRNKETRKNTTRTTRILFSIFNATEEIWLKS